VFEPLPWQAQKKTKTKVMQFLAWLKLKVELYVISHHGSTTNTRLFFNRVPSTVTTNCAMHPSTVVFEKKKLGVTLQPVKRSNFSFQVVNLQEEVSKQV